MTYSLTPIFFSFFYVTLFCSIQIPVISLSIDLIHRDSLGSPLYNPSLTHYNRLSDAFHRSISHASYFHKRTANSADDIQSQTLPSGGAYIMKLSIGTPPVPIFSIVDTGSDLTWTQCKPCPHCFTQVAPLFDPKKSSTYVNVPCKAKTCTSLMYPVGCSFNTCKYTVTYGDQSVTFGDLASETFTVGATSGKTISIRNMFFGCGHDNTGTFKNTSTGIIGLGGGSISFVKQLGGSIGGKFSYCLPRLDSAANVRGKINFGDSAVVSGSGVVSTPLIKSQVDSFYRLTLESISVGSKILSYKSVAKSFDDVGNKEGNIIIDSGTTLTLLPSEFTNKLETELKHAIRKTPTKAPGGFSLCYKVSDKIKVPTVMIKFTGAELEVSGESVFLKINDDLVCLTFVASDEIAIYGNLAQMNYLVGYDLVKNNVSFKQMDCTKK